MSLTAVSRRSFIKVAAVASAATALSVEAAANMVPSDKAWADDAEQEIYTSCRACISNCSVIATVKNGRVIKLKGDPQDPMSKGRMCPKGLVGIQALYHPNRNKYPLRRVGEKPGNKWERISWDEAAQEVARAMINMRDKTGKHGLLTTTGGGGNPQFAAPQYFMSVWGAGNTYEPGCAQCFLPRNMTMPLINGVNNTSIADGRCTELFKPKQYFSYPNNGMCEVYVMWGTGPAWHAPSTNGRLLAEMRRNGTKTVVIDPRFTADASKADIWLPIKPGTDMAMMLGWMNYIISNKLYEKIPGYSDFAEKWTNLPFLIDPRDKVSLPPVAENLTSDGALLRASEVFADCDSSTQGYVFYDTVKGTATKAYALSPEKDVDDYHPQLFGTVNVTLKDGSVITCKTAFQAYADRCADFDLETTGKITGCDPEKIKEAIELYCSTAHGGISLGVATDMYPGAAQAAIGAAALDCMTAHISHYGCPACNIGGPGASGLGTASTQSPMTLSGSGKTSSGHDYNFMPKEAILERLGYSEHKGLGHWSHSHIPSILSAILTGEPYQPKIWIERSGNKMVALGNSSSWVDAFPKFDLIVHCYMYPTSFTTEAADIVFPACEWLETAFADNRLNLNILRQPVTNLFEAADEVMMWSKIAEAMSDPSSDLYDANMEASMDPEVMAKFPGAKPYYKTINEYWDWIASKCGNPAIKTMDEAKKVMPQWRATDDEYWGGTKYDSYLLPTKVNDQTLYTGFSTAALDIKDNPMKCSPYGDNMLFIGRHGKEKFEMPPATVDYNPMPYYFQPEDERDYGDEYPLFLTEGRIPYFHHGTLRNNPYLRELYPAPELWASHENAAKYGLKDGDWVNIKSPRTDGKDVFRDITSGIDPVTILAKNKKDGPSEFAPGAELTSNGQSIVSGGIHAITRVTDGIAQDTVYMERFWNPEFLEDGSDGRKSWTLENMNVLTKNTGFYNPEFGTYTLRGIRVKIEKSSKPEGIWYYAKDFEPWMPVASDNTGGGCYKA